MKIPINNFVDIEKDLLMINHKRVLNKEILNFEGNLSIYHYKSMSKTTTFIANSSLSIFKNEGFTSINEYSINKTFLVDDLLKDIDLSSISRPNLLSNITRIDQSRNQNIYKAKNFLQKKNTNVIESRINVIERYQI